MHNIQMIAFGYFFLANEINTITCVVDCCMAFPTYASSLVPIVIAKQKDYYQQFPNGDGNFKSNRRNTRVMECYASILRTDVTQQHHQHKYVAVLVELMLQLFKIFGNIHLTTCGRVVTFKATMFPLILFLKNTRLMCMYVISGIIPLTMGQGMVTIGFNDYMCGGVNIKGKGI